MKDRQVEQGGVLGGGTRMIGTDLGSPAHSGHANAVREWMDDRMRGRACLRAGSRSPLYHQLLTGRGMRAA